jgi:hypothetical protein
MLDCGSYLSYVRRDVFSNIKRLSVPHTVEAVGERCLMANAAPHMVTEAVTLPMKIQSFSWKIRLLVLDYCPVPCILGADVLTVAKMRLDFVTRRYSFLFKPEQEFEFTSLDVTQHLSQEFPCHQEAFSSLMCGSLKNVVDDSFSLEDLMHDFPALFSDGLGTVKGMVCHIDLMDTTRVRSRPYQCSPPRLQELQKLFRI